MHYNVLMGILDTKTIGWLAILSEKFRKSKHHM